MTQTTDTISDDAKRILRENVEDVMVRGPGLRYSMGICVLARDSIHHTVLLGGLGGMGVGQLWFIDNDDKKRLPGYHDAPEQPEGAYFNDFTGRWVLPQ